jgi:cytochrome c-type biogenesis protein CcmE
MKLRFLLGSALVLGVVTWLAVTGFEQGKAYYHTCNEIAAMGHKAYGAKMRMAGLVVDGSIRREGDELRFSLQYEGATFPVRYVGSDPVPDTFKDGAETVVDGSLDRDGVFVGHKIQAKCASKYEAEYGAPEGGAKGSPRPAA